MQDRRRPVAYPGAAPGDTMDFEHSERARTLLAQVEAFMAARVLPN